MSLMRNVLKEYLVKIKTEVDQEAKKKAVAELDTTKSMLSNLFSFVGKGATQAAAITTSAIMGVNAVIAKTIDSVSDADVEAARFARRMWTTKENAQATLTALDAVGSSWEDMFYMTNEEFERFIELKNLASNLQPPDDLNDTLVLIRDIGQEVDSLGIILQYAKKWFTAAFGAYAKEDLQEIRDTLGSLNDYLIKYLPIVTDKLAQFAYIFFRLGKTGVTLITQLTNAVFGFLDRIPNKTKAAGVGVAAFMALFSAGPIGIFIGVLAALLLLLDDFYVWQKGGKSLLGDMWQKLSDSLEDSDSTLNNVFETIEKIFGLLDKVVDIVFDVGSGIGEWAVESGLAERVLKDVNTVIGQTLTLVNTTIDSINILLDGLGLLGDVMTGKKRPGDLWKGMVQGSNDIFETISRGFWDFTLPFFGATREEVFGADAEEEARREARREAVRGAVRGFAMGFEMEAAKSKRDTGSEGFNAADWNREGFGFSGVESNTAITNNQTNNITVQQASGESAYGTGSKVADSIASNREFFTMVR